MHDSNRPFEGFAKMAADAMETLNGMRAELEKLARQQLERMLAESDLVTREEFEVVRGMAAKARQRQQVLEKQVADLEARLAALETGDGTATTNRTPTDTAE